MCSHRQFGVFARDGSPLPVGYLLPFNGRVVGDVDGRGAFEFSLGQWRDAEVRRIKAITITMEI